MKIKMRSLRKLLSEAMLHPVSEAELALENAVNIWTQETQGRFEAEDSSMAVIGESAWNARVDRASQELRQRLAEAITDIERDLMSGEYAEDERLSGFRNL